MKVSLGFEPQVGDMALEPDGDIVVAGSVERCAHQKQCFEPSPFVARLNPDGTLDRGFGHAGVWIGPTGAALNCVALVPGGIYATGWIERPRTGRDLLLVRLHR